MVYILLKLSSTVFYNLQFLHILFLSLTLLWLSFFLVNSTISYSKELNKKQVIVKDTRLSQLSSELVLSKVSVVIVIVSIFSSFPLKFISGYIFFDQLFIHDTSRLLFILTLSAYLIPTLFNFYLSISKLSVPTDYSCTNTTFFLIAPFLVLSPNFYSFFFIIELLGVIILVKFIFLPMTYSSKGEKKGVLSSNPRPLLVSIFNYYWMSFFSSSFIILYIIIILFTWGTSDYYELNLLDSFSKFTMISTTSLFYSLLGLMFSLGFLLKAGAAPFHTYKLTLYRGLPLLSIVNYTFMFYITYIVYFSYIIPILVHTTGIISSLFLLLIIVLGSIMLLISLFSNRQLKSFLALSSSINIISILLILLCVR